MEAVQQKHEEPDHFYNSTKALQKKKFKMSDKRTMKITN